MQPKFLLFLPCFLIAFSANAQLQKGNRLAGLTVATGLWSGSEMEVTGPNQSPSRSENNNFSLQLTPSVGWFLTDQTVLGASVTIGISNQVSRRKSGGVTFMENNYSNVDFGAGTFLRYYFKSSSTFRPFTHLFCSAGSGKTGTDGFHYYTSGGENVKSTYEGNSSGRFYYNAGINAGVTRLLSANTGIDLYVGYLRSYNKATTKTEQLLDYSTSPDLRSNYETTDKYTSNGISFGVGFQVFLSRQ